MTVPDFLGTNILVYAYDPSDRGKQRIAREFVRKAIAGNPAVSTQVLAEFCATLLDKMKPPAGPEQLAAILNALGPAPAVAPDGDPIRRAVEAHAAYGLHFYDAMIVASAERVGCGRILSEDLNAGQEYFGIAVENPFRN